MKGKEQKYKKKKTHNKHKPCAYISVSKANIQKYKLGWEKYIEWVIYDYSHLNYISLELFFCWFVSFLLQSRVFSVIHRFFPSPLRYKNRKVWIATTNLSIHHIEINLCMSYNKSSRAHELVPFRNCVRVFCLFSFFCFLVLFHSYDICMWS